MRYVKDAKQDLVLLFYFEYFRKIYCFDIPMNEYMNNAVAQSIDIKNQGQIFWKLAYAVLIIMLPLININLSPCNKVISNTSHSLDNLLWLFKKFKRFKLLQT